MKTQNAICPADSALRDFGLGKLDAASAETVSQHLETCDGCRQRVASLPGDSFVDRLRDVGDNSKAAGQAPQKPQRTFVPGESIASVIGSSDTSQSGILRNKPAAAIEKAPPELANHPDYELMQQLGQGGMGTVYLARHRITHRLEVLKVVSKSLLDHPGAMERFQSEIRSACSLAHPNIVAAYGVLHLGDMLILVMEYVKGQDMSQLVKRKGPLPIANAAFYGHQAALGLQHAHEKGMVHRDIKPNNLMLAVEGKKHIVKILDFGLAKSTSEKAANHGLTKSGQMLGTPDYVAPEQTLKANKADIRSDIYSLGCTLYFLLSGGPPFQEESLYEILQAHHTRDPRPLNLVRPEVPLELASVVAKMMAKDPARRFQTPVEVARALLPFFKPGQTVAPPPAGTGPSQPAADTEHGLRSVTPAAAIAPPPVQFPMPVVASVAQAKAAPTTTEPYEDFSVSIDTQRHARPPRRGTWASLPPWQRMTAVLAAGAAASLLLGIVFLVETKDGGIRVEINDPVIEVAIKGTNIVLKKADNGHDVKLSPGQKSLIVERDDFRFETDKLILKKGETVMVKVTLLDGWVRVMRDNTVIDKRELPKPTPTPGGTMVDATKRFGFEIPDPLLARWWIDGNELVQSAVNENITILFDEPAMQDLDFSVEVQRTDGADSCGIFFGHRDSWNTNLFVACWRNKDSVVLTEENGQLERLALSNGSFETGKWYHLKLVMRGTLGECFLDGNQILTFHTKEQPRGRLGLRTWNAAYRFRNIKIAAPDGKVLIEGLPNLGAEPPVKDYELDEIKVLAARGGSLPTNANGKPLNFDFETGDLRDWIVDGSAFANQPKKGDTLHERYKYLHSHHAGQFWIGGDEGDRDHATGTMTSNPFIVTHPYASFLTAGGGVFTDEAVVELVLREDNKTFFRAAGCGSDTLQPVVVDLSQYIGKEVFIRVADRSSGPCGRVSFDDFRFHQTMPHFAHGYISLAGVKPGKTMDLLGVLDIERDSRGGQWHWDAQHRLVGEGWRRIQLPVLVPDAYDLAVTVEGVEGYYAGEVQVWLQVGGRRVNAMIDGFGYAISGLSSIDGKGADANESTHRGIVSERGRPNKLLYQVRPRSVKVLCNGEVIIDWQGDPSRLSLPHGDSVSGIEGLAIFGSGGDGAGWRLSQLDLTPVDPNPEIAPFDSEPLRAIVPFNAEQARAHQEAWAEQLGTKVEIENSLLMKLRLIPPGKFKMGSPAGDADAQDDEKPQVEVTLTHPLYVSKTEVTQGQWQAVMNTTPWRGEKYVKEGAEYAASYVTWDDAQAFCEKLSDKEGLSYRLLTEAEWEYACRAGTTTKYHFGDDGTALGSYAWFEKNASSIAEEYAHEVAKKQPNPFGLYDMHGNVWEWCEDLYAAKLSGGENPSAITGDGYRVFRGGGWNFVASGCRSAFRRWNGPAFRWFDQGFRLALVPFSQAKGSSK